MNSDMISYYSERASEYEKVYSKPERQDELLLITQILQEIFRNKDIFEIACGTGYWTEKIAKTGKTILAIDINETVIKIARTKLYAPARVDFKTADIFINVEETKYQSLFGGFIWSHIRIQDINNFIAIISNFVLPGGTIVFIDNNYVEGSSLQITEIDEYGNSYQIRHLENGSTHKVLKNFPTETHLRNLLKEKAGAIEFINLEYYWILKYTNLKME